MALPPFRKLNAKGDELFTRGQDNAAEVFRALSAKQLLITGESALFLEATVTVPDEWQSVTFGTDWGQWADANFANVGYRKSPDGRRIELRGLADSIDAGVATTIFTLPVGYRPASSEVHVTNANSTIARVDVTAAGVVTYGAGDRTQWFNLFGLWLVADGSAPSPASCWPIQIPCALKVRPNAVLLASAVETASGVAVAAANPDWDWDTQAGQNFIIINNVPFLPPATYDLTFAVLGVT
jgi:hypothetical protein